jgi:transposase InsO family protein
MSAEMTAQLVTDALVMAIWRRGKPRELMHHSDQGSQYTSEQFQRLLAEQCHYLQHEPVWQRMGQLSDGEFLLELEDGTSPSSGVCNA